MYNVTGLLACLSGATTPLACFFFPVFYPAFFSENAWAETVTLQFNYTGATEQWTVPAGVTSVNFDIAGQEGRTKRGRLRWRLSQCWWQWRVGLSDLQVTPGDILYINIGGISGWNGGGNGGAFDAYPNLFNAGGRRRRQRYPDWLQ